MLINKDIDKINQTLAYVKNQYNDWAQARGMSDTEFKIHYILYGETGVTQKLICDKYSMPKQTVNNVINALVKNGTVILKPGIKDRREKTIELSDSGRKEVGEKIADIYNIENRVIEKLGQEKLELLLNSVTSFGDILGEIMGEKE